VSNITKIYKAIDEEIEGQSRNKYNNDIETSKTLKKKQVEIEQSNKNVDSSNMFSVNEVMEGPPAFKIIKKKQKLNCDETSPNLLKLGDAIRRNTNIFKIDQNKVENVINEDIDENERDIDNTDPNSCQRDQLSNNVTFTNAFAFTTTHSIEKNNGEILSKKDKNSNRKNLFRVKRTEFPKIIQSIFSNYRNAKNIRRSGDIINTKMFEESLKHGIINKNTTSEAKVIQQLLIKDYKMDIKNNFKYTKNNNVRNLSLDSYVKNTNTNYLNELIQNEMKMKKKQKENLITEKNERNESI